MKRLIGWRTSAALERARAWSHALADRIAFVVESACIGVSLLGLLTFLVCRLDWRTVTHEWGNFWTHYAAADAAARGPVDTVLVTSTLVATALVAWTRFNKARHAFAPFNAPSDAEPPPARSDRRDNSQRGGAASAAGA